MGSGVKQCGGAATLTASLRKVASYFGAKRVVTAGHGVIPLSYLKGMSYDHVLRMEREGFDCVENFVHADPAFLAVRTGFSAGQLRQWVSEAWLATHLRDDYTRFVDRTGVSGQSELRRFLAGCECRQAAQAALNDAVEARDLAPLRHKIAIVLSLLDPPRAACPATAAAGSLSA